MNYNLAHLLHITPKETHYVATALLSTFRGFAGSFGSAIGGGVFQRKLTTSLTSKLDNANLTNPQLVRELLGKPALVDQLHGMEREIAIESYQDALKILWLAMAAVAVVSFLCQAGTGWQGHLEKQILDEERRALLGDGRRDDHVRDIED